jgi:hypothetical protein
MIIMTRKATTIAKGATMGNAKMRIQLGKVDDKKYGTA